MCLSASLTDKKVDSLSIWSESSFMRPHQHLRYPGTRNQFTFENHNFYCFRRLLVLRLKLSLFPCFLPVKYHEPFHPNRLRVELRWAFWTGWQKNVWVCIGVTTSFIRRFKRAVKRQQGGISQADKMCDCKKSAPWSKFDQFCLCFQTPIPLYLFIGCAVSSYFRII